MHEMLDGRHTAAMMIVVALATLMDGLDGSIVSIALPTIARDIGVDTATSSWVTVVYFLVLASLLIPFARVSATKGVRNVLAGGLAVFTLGSLFCGLSSSFVMLIIFRAIQAVGAAMMAAAGPMCCTEHLPLHKLGFGMAVVTIGASLGFALGPVIGGFLVEFTHWSWIFLINIPIGAAAVALILYAIPSGTERNEKMNFDYRGMAVLCTAIVLGTLAIEIAPNDGMLVPAAVCGLAALVFLALFVHIEHGRSEPLLKVSMFSDKGFLSVFICLMLANAAYMGMLYLIPFYCDIVMHKSTLETGVFLLIAAFITGVVGMPIAKWSDRSGRRWFCVTAGVLMTVFLALYAVWARDMDDARLLLVVVLQGFGWGFIGGPMASRLVEHAGDERDMASALMNEAYYIGGTFGTALAAMLFSILSGSGGIDIGSVPGGMFLDGYIPTAVVCTAMAVAVTVLSYILKDDD